jgi:LmbE family N-acetylglucosaminyl deacetylase
LFGELQFGQASFVKTPILVVAPHPDDDVIGCGGALHRAAMDGTPVHVVYVTDGAASHPGSRRFPPDRLAAIREAEARAALRELSITAEPAFLRLSDGALAELPEEVEQACIAEIARIARERGAQTVLAPWRRDPHPDHIATAALVERAAATLESVPHRLAYTVWSELRGGTPTLPSTQEATAFEVVLTPEEVEAKRRALARHRSQMTALVDDAPDGFRIDQQQLEWWLRPVERFYRLLTSETSSRAT